MNPDTDTQPAGGTPLNPKTTRSQAPLVQPTPGPTTHAVRLLWPTAIVLLVLVGSVVMVLTPWKATRPTTDLDVAGTPPQVHHDSGIARLLREREQELGAQHDSGIARLLREREQELGAQHDSGIARLLREREQELGAQHDSGIARLLREREQEPRSAP